MSIKRYLTKKNVIETVKYLGGLAVMVICKIIGGRKL
jgi:hypothetical protein